MYIYGNKVLLRSLEKEDMEDLRKSINSPTLENLVVGWSFPVSISAQQEWFDSVKNDKSNLRFAIEETTHKRVIGMVSLGQIDWKNRVAVTGIKLYEDAPHNSGYGFDAMTALIKYAFRELNFHKLKTHVLDYNKPSIRLHEKLGFVQEGIAREAIYKNGQYHNLIYFGLLASEYK